MIRETGKKRGDSVSLLSLFADPGVKSDAGAGKVCVPLPSTLCLFLRQRVVLLLVPIFWNSSKESNLLSCSCYRWCTRSHVRDERRGIPVTLPFPAVPSFFCLPPVSSDFCCSDYENKKKSDLCYVVGKKWGILSLIRRLKDAGVVVRTQDVSLCTDSSSSSCARVVAGIAFPVLPFVIVVCCLSCC